MADQIFDTRLGRSVLDTDTCSKCGHTIPEEHVPIILWDNVDRMWVYCATCELALVPMLDHTGRVSLDQK